MQCLQKHVYTTLIVWPSATRTQINLQFISMCVTVLTDTETYHILRVNYQTF